MKQLSLSLTIVVTAALLASSTAAASSANGHRQVVKLRRELRHMTVLRNKERARASALKRQVAALTSKYAKAQSEIGALRAQISAVPTPLAVAVEQVRREVAWADGGAATPPGALIAKAALDYTVGHVSTAAYGYLEMTGGSLPGDDPNTILGDQAGICGHAAQVFAAIVRSFGLPLRSVQFWFTDPGGAPDSHIAVEVSYGGAWHYFDPTFGQFWTNQAGDVLDITTVRADGGTLVKDEASFTNLVENAALGDDSAYETDPATIVTIGGASLGG